MAMNWLALKAHTEDMSKEQQETDVTIYDESLDEYFCAEALLISPPHDDILDADHPYISYSPV